MPLDRLNGGWTVERVEIFECSRAGRELTDSIVLREVIFFIYPAHACHVINSPLQFWWASDLNSAIADGATPVARSSVTNLQISHLMELSRHA